MCIRVQEAAAAVQPPGRGGGGGGEKDRALTSKKNQVWEYIHCVQCTMIKFTQLQIFVEFTELKPESISDGEFLRLCYSLN